MTLKNDAINFIYRTLTQKLSRERASDGNHDIALKEHTLVFFTHHWVYLMVITDESTFPVGECTFRDLVLRKSFQHPLSSTLIS